MKSKIITIGLVLVAVINVSALVTFAYHRWLRAEGRSVTLSAADSSVSFENQLSLSGEQKNCLKDLKVSFHAEIKDIQANIQEKRELLVEEMKKEAPDISLIDKLIEEISRLQAEIQKKAVLNIFQENKLLNQEQREQFFQMLENHVCPKKHGQEPDVNKHNECINSH